MITKAFQIIIFICDKFFTVVLRISFHCKNFRIDSAQRLLESNSAGDKTNESIWSQLRVIYTNFLSFELKD